MRVQIAASMVLALVITATPAHAQAQITTGVIQGLVRDSTGAVVPGVTVEANNVETNLTQTRVTATDGRFVFLQLPPGRYKVTFTLAGFGTVVQDGIVLTVGQSVNLAPQLSVSTVTEVVTVTGTPVVETTRAAVASTLSEATIAGTPILGRKFEDLLTLTPGVSVVQDPTVMRSRSPGSVASSTTSAWMAVTSTTGSSANRSAASGRRSISRSMR